MNPVTAINLHNATLRAVLKCNEADPESFAEFYRVFPIFRDSLSCLVCGKLLQHAMAPRNSTCEHSVCKACKGKTMSKKLSCGGCKDYEQFAENRRLNLLVGLYWTICKYMSYPPLVEHIASAAEESPEIMFMLEDVLRMKLKQESSDALDMHSSILPLSPAMPLELPSGSELTEQSSSSLDACVALKDEPQEYAVQVKDEPTDSLEISLSELLNMDAATAQESTASSYLNTMVLSSVGDIKHEPVLFSVDEALENLQSSSVDKQSHGLQQDLVMSVWGASGQTEPRACTQQQQNPLPGISCSAVTPRTVRVHRKRSRSESDSVKVKPLPVTSFIEEPPVAAPAPPTVTYEPKDIPHPLAKIPSEGFLRLQQALLGTTANIEQSLEQSVKRVCARSPKKDKTQQSPTPGITLRSPPKVYKKTKERKGCKCGRATQNPSVLTCRGQRCPCYSSRRACLDCICRGCQNSYMANGEKKLEAFAVPEKALEQTRLTLGINYTGIPVRNAGANQSVVSVSADSAMATFLLASSQDTSQHQKNF
ncbi:hypothetical protein ACEWY4_006747 [Coilia grayii]|uniref:CXC MSL2-type domain-containing protein n=1 Tax=Coilia grayii TaxID=363190 RepID=A0ABD1KEA8_9TELE